MVLLPASQPKMKRENNTKVQSNPGCAASCTAKLPKVYESVWLLKDESRDRESGSAGLLHHHHHQQQQQQQNGGTYNAYKNNRKEAKQRPNNIAASTVLLPDFDHGLLRRCLIPRVLLGFGERFPPPSYQAVFVGFGFPLFSAPGVTELGICTRNRRER